MAKKKKKRKAFAVPEAPMREPQRLTLRGKDVLEDASIDDVVTLTVTGKVTEIARHRYDKNRLTQDIEISSVKVVKA